MCGTCGCADGNSISIQTPKEHQHAHHHDDKHTHHHGDHKHDHDHNHIIEVEQNILQHNDVAAARNRGYFEAKNIFTLNLVSSPGSGKTSLLERTLADLKKGY